MNDLQKRAKIWTIDGRVIICDSCIVKMSAIDKIHNVRYKIGCGYEHCKKEGRYELEMRF